MIILHLLVSAVLFVLGGYLAKRINRFIVREPPFWVTPVDRAAPDSDTANEEFSRLYILLFRAFVSMVAGLLPGLIYLQVFIPKTLSISEGQLDFLGYATVFGALVFGFLVFLKSLARGEPVD